MLAWVCVFVHVRMFICPHVCVHAGVYTCLCTSVNLVCAVCLCVSVFNNLCVCVNVLVYACLCVRTFVCIFVFVDVFLYLCGSVYTCSCFVLYMCSCLCVFTQSFCICLDLCIRDVCVHVRVLCVRVHLCVSLRLLMFFVFVPVFCYVCVHACVCLHNLFVFIFFGCVCMFVCVSVCACMHAGVCTALHVSTLFSYLCTFLYIRLFINVRVCARDCVYTHLLCVSVFMYACACLYVCLCGHACCCAHPFVCLCVFFFYLCTCACVCAYLCVRSCVHTSVSLNAHLATVCETNTSTKDPCSGQWEELIFHLPLMWWVISSPLPLSRRPPARIMNIPLLSLALMGFGAGPSHLCVCELTDSQPNVGRLKYIKHKRKLFCYKNCNPTQWFVLAGNQRAGFLAALLWAVGDSGLLSGHHGEATRNFSNFCLVELAESGLLTLGLCSILGRNGWKMQ
uniref:Uncharacterized protein n=1 Tax=Oryzias latipes TaxID=8090 RepID=A0A3B3HS79_ORYLA